ncbi:hypothetical protein ILUMI_09325 [Ignelater luminosus]|uniref:Uncharacterized protein n=1 Tax=Ignelater luminosus TaxID=2038154 RepID=A0A8K0GEM6_IGNLU|nr:hypothetical protein ILUMI_09325 [Ignelater luminosus]
MNPFMYELERDGTKESHYNDIVKLFNALRVEKPQFKLKCRSVAAVYTPPITSADDPVGTPSFSPGRQVQFEDDTVVELPVVSNVSRTADFEVTTFLPYDYESSLWDKIWTRTQGPDKPVAVYPAIMENVSRRLPLVPLETTRMHLIRGNLQLYLQSQLALQFIT